MPLFGKTNSEAPPAISSRNWTYQNQALCPMTIPLVTRSCRSGRNTRWILADVDLTAYVERSTTGHHEDVINM